MYGKLFSSLYQGTLRGRSDEILVFTNLLAHADQHGNVDKHWKAISDETGLSKERVEAAITTLEAPDAESRSPELDGRRITRLDDHRAWGWHIVNHGKYRAIRSEDDRREQNRQAQQRWRNKQISNNNKQNKPRSAHTDTDTDTGKPNPIVGLAPDAPPNGHDKSKSAGKGVLPFISDAEDVLNYLNATVGKGFQFRNPKGALTPGAEMIIHRLKEGYTREQMREIVMAKASKWRGDEKMDEYLRPATLFNKTNFDKYLGELHG
jgi:uncharacterized phage protein (TIGR02220 family)